VCRRNRDEKKNLEFDWSDKKEADELDTKCAILRNEDTNKQFYPGAARFQEMYAAFLSTWSSAELASGPKVWTRWPDPTRPGC